MSHAFIKDDRGDFPVDGESGFSPVFEASETALYVRKLEVFYFSTDLITIIIKEIF